MTIRQLSLTDFRNLQSTTLDFDHNLNLIYGSNASGKTSLLESIHVICQGRSFKSPRLDDCINHDKDGFLLFAKFDKYKSGISRNKNETHIKINGEVATRLSNLAELTPIKIINSDSFQLITGSPSLKREYIDWCLFHVEHQYHELWILFNHALKQRNALLRSPNNTDQLDYWDKYLCDYSYEIFDYRKKYINQLSEIMDNNVSGLIEDLSIKMEYSPGWNTNQSLQEIYKKNRQKDIKYGYTQYGVHRDNITLKTHDYSAKQELSRGQQKRLSIALSLTQIILVKNISGKDVILLIDDIHSELDKVSIESINILLKNLDLQIFITSIDREVSLSRYHQQYKMFHVEHGIIRAVNKP